MPSTCLIFLGIELLGNRHVAWDTNLRHRSRLPVNWNLNTHCTLPSMHIQLHYLLTYMHTRYARMTMTK